MYISSGLSFVTWWLFKRSRVAVRLHLSSRLDWIILAGRGLRRQHNDETGSWDWTGMWVEEGQQEAQSSTVASTHLWELLLPLWQGKMLIPLKTRVGSWRSRCASLFQYLDCRSTAPLLVSVVPSRVRITIKMKAVEWIRMETLVSGLLELMWLITSLGRSEFCLHYMKCRFVCRGMF